VVVGALPVEDTLQTSVQTLLMPPPDLRDIDDVEARARHFSMFTDDSEAEKQRRLVADLKAMPSWPKAASGNMYLASSPASFSSMPLDFSFSKTTS
jgi:hypothetical protein